MSDPMAAIGRVISVNGSSVRGILCKAAGGNGAAPQQSANIQIGAIIRIATPLSSVFGLIGSLTVDDPAPEASDSTRRYFDVELLGEMPNGDGAGNGSGTSNGSGGENGSGSGNGSGGGKSRPGFQRGVASYPMLDEDIFLATRDEVALIYARPEASNVRVGTIHPDNVLPAYLATDDLLGKHFAVLGSTGSGKSCSTALILRAILEEHPNGHVVMLDPHNEYFQAFDGMADVLSPDQLRLPYWLLNFEEVVEVMIGRGRPDTDVQSAILKNAIVAAKKKYAAEKSPASDITVDTPIPYNIGDLITSIGNQMGQLNKPENSIPYMRLKARLENLRADRRYAFMFSRLVVEDALPGILSRILSIPVRGKPITIVDLSGVPSEIVDVVVSVMCRMIFDFALWSVPAQALPVLLVCEEAHRYVPRNAEDGFGPTKKVLSRIAMEGRKYGVSLCLVSQRPSQLSPNILSQCNTLFALRMSNERDQEVVRMALPETAHGLLAALPSLRTQEAVVVGEGVSLPLRLRFDDLADGCRPKSGNADFSTRWKQEDQEQAFIYQTIIRWRMQAR